MKKIAYRSSWRKLDNTAKIFSLSVDDDMSVFRFSVLFKDKVKVYVEGKPFGGVATTIVDLTKEKPILIRQGVIKIEDILNVWED